MQGSSQGAHAAVLAALEEQLAAQVDVSELAENLLSVAATVAGSGMLRRALADAARSGQDRAALMTSLMRSHVSEPALQVAAVAAQQRWHAPVDLSDSLEAVGVEAVLAHAEKNGRLGQVEDELFRFQRIAAADTDLQQALSDRRATLAAKRQLLITLLIDRVAPETLRLSTQALASPLRFGQALQTYLTICSRRQDQLTAVLTSAVPLTEEQVARITSALSDQYERSIHANVVIDPRVIGGVRVEIGDDIIEGTVRSRLEDARRQLTS